MRTYKHFTAFFAALMFLSTVLAAAPTVDGLSFSPSDPAAGEEVQITVTASDDAGVNKINAYYSGSWHSKDCGGAGYCTRQFYFTPSSGGSYTVKAQAIDDTYTYSDVLTRELDVRSAGELSLSMVTAQSFDLRPGDHFAVFADVENSGSTKIRATVKWYLVKEGRTSGTRIAEETYDVDPDGRRLQAFIDYSDVRDAGVDPGDYTLKAVLYQDGVYRDTLTASETFTVHPREENKDPVARFSYSPSSPETGENIRFDASESSDPDGYIKKYEWDFNDNGYFEESGKTVYHSFSSSGTRDVTLKVTDSNGAGDTRTRSIYVSPGEEEDATLKVYTRDSDGDDINGYIRIYDTDSGNLEATGYAGSDGYRKFDLPADRYRIRVSRDGYRTETEYRTLDAGETERVFFYLDRTTEEDGSLEVTVKDDGDRIEDAKVQIENSDSRIDHTGSDGEVLFRSLEPDNYDITVSCEGEEETRSDVEVNPGDRAYRTVSLDSSLPDDRCDEDGKKPAARLFVNPDPAETGEEVTFDASDSSDPDGHIDRYWYDVDGDGDWDEKTTSDTITRYFNDPVHRTAVLKVVDSDGLTDTVAYRYEIVKKEETGSLEVTVKDRDGDRVEDARVKIRNGGSDVKHTGSNGETTFSDLEPDYYDITVTCDGETRIKNNVRVREDERSGTTVYLDTDISGDRCGQDGETTLDVRVLDDEGEPLNSARVEVENSDREVRYTGSSGYAFFDLRADDYDVKVSKTGYETETRSVDLDEGEDRLMTFRLDRTGDAEEGRIEITSLDYPSSVCEGGRFRVNATVENSGEFHGIVTLSGSGLGSITVGPEFSLAPGEEKTGTVTFSGVKGSGLESFRITATDHGSDSMRREVKVRDCVVEGDGKATGITLEVSPSKIRIGETIKVSGFVDGVRGRSDVTIRLDGRTAARVNTQPDGYYQAFITPDRVGELSVTADTGSRSATRSLEVLATTQVSFIEAPEKVFEGERFEICADVSSQIDPAVFLIRDGDVLAKKNGKGKVCFKTSATDLGTHTYEVAAVAGNYRSFQREGVKVLEMAPETSNFPDRIAAVESGSGVVRVSLYNTHEEPMRYRLSLEDVPEAWVSASEKEVILQKGEHREVFFYVTPKAEGTFNGTLKVEARGTTIHSQEIGIHAVDQNQEEPSWLDRLLRSLSFGL